MQLLIEHNRRRWKGSVVVLAYYVGARDRQLLKVASRSGYKGYKGTGRFVPGKERLSDLEPPQSGQSQPIYNSGWHGIIAEPVVQNKRFQMRQHDILQAEFASRVDLEPAINDADQLSYEIAVLVYMDLIHRDHG